MITLPAGLYKVPQPYGDVYGLGTLFDSAAAAPFHVGPYTTDRGTQVPNHWWNARFIDRTIPLTIKKSHADLVAANRMFPMGNTGCSLTSDPVTALPYTPMGSSSIEKNMPQTGERPDIGWVTDWAAWWALKGDAGPMLQIAQAASSCPIHFRDETTGKPIDLLKYFGANCYSGPQQGTPWLLRGPLNGQWPEWGGGWGPQQAHFCEMSGIAALATEDDGLLEELQYQANFGVLCDAYVSNHNGMAIVSGEVRGIGWALRQLFMAHIATKDREARGPLPTTCHPSSYFKKLLDQSLVYWSARMGGASQKIFRTWYNEAEKYSPWTEDYLGTALAYGVLTGHTDWLPIFLFKLGNAVARCSGKSGWPQCVPTPYRIPTLSYTSWAQAFDGLMTEPEVMMSKAANDAILANPANGGKLSDQEPYGYHFTTRALLVMADYLDKKGLANVRGTYPDFDAALGNIEVMFQAYGKVNPRVSVISTAPIVIPPPKPVPEPQPAPEPVPVPTPTPEPTPTPAPQPKPLARVTASASGIKPSIRLRAEKGETMIITVNGKDSCAIGPLPKTG